MPFRDPVRVLILPFGANPPQVGQAALKLDPGPPPSIKFYTGDADEGGPGDISGPVVSSRLILRLTSPDRVDSAAVSTISLKTGADILPGGTEIELSTESTAFTVPSTGEVTRIDTLGIQTSIAVMESKQSASGTDVLNLINTSYAAPSTSVGFSFVAPGNGKGLLLWRARMQITTTAAVLRTVFAAPRLGTGSTVGGGTAQALEGVTSPHDDVAVATGITAVGADTAIGHKSGHTLISGLGAGLTFNVQLQWRESSAVSASYDVISQSITWIPLPF